MSEPTVAPSVEQVKVSAQRVERLVLAWANHFERAANQQATGFCLARKHAEMSEKFRWVACYIGGNAGDPKLPMEVLGPTPAELRAADRYEKVGRAVGLKLAEHDLTKHPEPFEVEVDVTHITDHIDPEEIVRWHFGIGATHTARTTGAFHITKDGRFLLLFQVRPLTEEVTP
jgi:hypothetical protein